jgi:hypothetical protein
MYIQKLVYNVEKVFIGGKGGKKISSIISREEQSWLRTIQQQFSHVVIDPSPAWVLLW